MFKLNNLRSPVGSNHSSKRRGKGIGSGLGKTAGKGHKGQHARAGVSVGQVFEGGQVPMSRRMPKFGFSSPLRPLKIDVNISSLGRFTGEALNLKSIAPRSKKGTARLYVSIIGTKLPKTFPKSLEAHHVAPKTKELLETKGVSIKLLPYMDGARSVRPVKEKKKAAAKT